METLRRGVGEVLLAQRGCVLLRATDGMQMLWATNRKLARQAVRCLGGARVTCLLGSRTTAADVARELGLETTDNVLLLRRLRTVDGEPVLCQESWSNLRACPGLDEVDYATTSMFDAVEMCSGKKIRYSDMRYRARVAGKEHGRMLGCEESAAVLVLEQNIHLENGVAIEWSSTWLTPGQAIVSKAYQPE